MITPATAFYLRVPTLDQRIGRGDDFAGDAWREEWTGVIIHTAPGGYPPGVHYRQQPDGHMMLCNADGTRSIFDDVDE